MSLKILAAGVVATFLGTVGVAHGQALLSQDADFRNSFDPQGIPRVSASDQLTPARNDPRYEAYNEQFRSGSAFGGWLTTQILDDEGTLLAGPDGQELGPVRLKLPASQPRGEDGQIVERAVVQQAEASMSRPIFRMPVTYSLGSEIPAPAYDADGYPVGERFFLQKPANSDGNDSFYYSVNSGLVYATNPGVVTIQWRERESGEIDERTYSISGLPSKPERTIYWTEGSFAGPPVEIPSGRVNEVKVIYNENFPKIARDPHVSENQVENPGEEMPIEQRTLWVEERASRRQLHAFNLEGRVLVEYLGNSKGDGVRKEHLGIEIVRVVKEARPETVTVALGDELQPPQGSGTASQEEGGLQPKIVAGAPEEETPFIYQQPGIGQNRTRLYAVRTTVPGVEINGVEQQIGNEALVFWEEKGLMNIWWPKHYAGYLMKWPESLNRYSLFARPDSSTAAGLAEAEATAVPLSPSNNPKLMFQDDSSGQQAEITRGRDFLTKLTPANPDNRSLLLYAKDSRVWFERVYSHLSSQSELKEQRVDFAATDVYETGDQRISNVSLFSNGESRQEWVEGRDYRVDYGQGVVTKLPSGRIRGEANVVYQTTLRPNDESDHRFTAEVGSRIEPPPGSADAMVGHIRSEVGDAYDPDAYIDPLVAGFDEAKKGAIIGVNAVPGKDTLEVWWYRKGGPSGADVEPTWWPGSVQRFRLRWPSDAEPIVLASNEGTGVLSSNQANGSIYVQNDARSPGYNPNEEHAQMIGGRGWALRDDLNTPASSAPYVLLSYTETDQRPAMRVFPVIRESEEHRFVYEATAGTILQAPMPLPLMDLPLAADGSVKNREVSAAVDPPAGSSEGAEFERYTSFTHVDRKGSHWIYRGPHGWDPAAQKPEFAMNYYYRTRKDFAFPGRNMPQVGTIVPYLRPRAGNGEFAGDPVRGEAAIQVRFRPAWPEDVPELRIGQTLTEATAGLPQVRGQSSVEVLYQQSVARDDTPDTAFEDRLKSATLFDPTRAKSYEFEEAGGLDRLPASLNTSAYFGKTYFPDLPPHLSKRFYVDPNVGPHGALMLVGEYRDDTVGEKYLQLNVLSDRDRQNLIELCDRQDQRRGAWEEAIGNLETVMETYREDPQSRGNYVVDLQENRSVGPQELAVVHSKETAVDSYALSASGGGDGYLVFSSNDGEAFTPQSEPVSLHVIKVLPPLYRGQLKVVQSENPLAEKLTLEHTSDFAGELSDYEFEWRYASPVGGLPPQLFGYRAVRYLGESDDSNSAWTSFANPGSGFAELHSPDHSSSGEPVELANDALQVPAMAGDWPGIVLRRNFEVSRMPLDAFLSMDLPKEIGARVFVNGELVANARTASDRERSGASQAAESFDLLSLSYSLPTSLLRRGGNVMSVELYSDRERSLGNTLGFRIEGRQQSVDLAAWQPLSPAPSERAGNVGSSIIGKPRHVVEGAGLMTLTDHYFTMRYRAREKTNATYDEDRGWSNWVEPQLAEGWIKRALAGINPFEQRTSELFNNKVNTQTSLVAEAGPRWEGNVALNLENVDDHGLIQIYETILNRGKKLSIDGTPSVSDGGANDALLLASGYLNDLYMILGNEAFADAENPTIAFNLSGSEIRGDAFGDFATSLYAFKGQLSSLLDEELALLRGHDDFLPPGTDTSPVYNRLVWNYTRGIQAGEAVYALNYGIRDIDHDGVVDAEDAADLYPQGHGDAYGHYLTALTGYYGLLTNPSFSWEPRPETVQVLGQPVAVDYQDERKFAAAAASLSRTSSQIAALSYRQHYDAHSETSWTSMRDGRVNSSTGIARRWGVDDWLSRGGQGAYLHWVTANSLLPSSDDNPDHEGIQKIDRTTVPELDEITAQARAIQSTADDVDAQLNPLGLANGSMAFDISPSEIDAGKTHFEQIHERAVTALGNAAQAFEKAKSATEFLARQDQSKDEKRAAIYKQEEAYTHELIEIYGTPYPDDIGPGGTYQQGYEGPDLFHASYVDITEEITDKSWFPIDEKTYTLHTKIEPSKVADANFELRDTTTTTDHGLELPAGVSNEIEYEVGEISGMVRRPDEWTGRRASPGKIQTAVSDMLLARQRMSMALHEYSQLGVIISKQLGNYRSALETYEKKRKLRSDFKAEEIEKEWLKTVAKRAAKVAGYHSKLAQELGEAQSEALPQNVGMSNDVSSVGRSGIWLSFLGASKILSVEKLILEEEINAMEIIQKANKLELELDIEGAEWKHENRLLIADLKETLRSYAEKLSAVNLAVRRHNQAQRDLATIQARGQRVQKERQTFRERSAAVIQGYRTRDVGLRAFRTEALEKYDSLFDLAAQYTYLAARAYDYETGLLDVGSDFHEKIVRSRAIGVLKDGEPQFGGSDSGDPGLSGVLEEMSDDWDVIESRFGFNNPDRYRTTLSLREEKFRIVPGPEGDRAWKETLKQHQMEDITEDPDVRRHCMQIVSPDGDAVPGIVIDFQSVIEEGVNFFGQPLAGGDHTFSPTSFATKIRSSGIALEGYIGMDSPTSTGSTLSGIGANSPEEPNTGFTDPQALSATPYVYLIPAGADTMRAPLPGAGNPVRRWEVEDQAIPMPFNIGNVDFDTNPRFQSKDSLHSEPFVIRKHQAFRAVPEGTVFPSDPGFTNSRLIGRSAWNSRWKIVIPGKTLLSNPQLGLLNFTQTVSDIKLHLETYSYSGD